VQPACTEDAEGPDSHVTRHLCPGARLVTANARRLLELGLDLIDPFADTD
jgi:hypothetical protein